MVQITSLPVELLQEICRHLKGDKKNFRGTCSYINNAILPQVFSSISILLGCYQHTYIALLEALAGSTRISPYVQKLRIFRLALDEDLSDREELGGAGTLSAIDAAREKTKRFLEPALSSLRNLKELWWHITICDSLPLLRIAIFALSTLPNLQLFDLNVWSMPMSKVPLFSFTNLTSLSIEVTDYESDYKGDHFADTFGPAYKLLAMNHRQLKTLSIINKLDTDNQFPLAAWLSKLTDTMSLKQLSAHGCRLESSLPVLRHFSVLTALDLGHPNTNDNDLDDGFWHTLRAKDIYLTELSTINNADALFLEYVAFSANTLRSLEFRPTARRNEMEARFYDEVLPRLGPKLQVLKILSNSDEEVCWALDEHHVDLITRMCKHLRTLHVVVSVNRSPPVIHSLLDRISSLRSLTELKILRGNITEPNILLFRQDMVFLKQLLSFVPAKGKGYNPDLQILSDPKNVHVISNGRMDWG